MARNFKWLWNLELNGYLPANSYPVLTETFSIDNTGQQFLLVFHPSKKRIVVDPVSASILGLCDGSRCINEISSVLAIEFNRSHFILRRNVSKLLRRYIKLRLIDLHIGTTPAPFIILPTSTVIGTEVEDAVRFRMGRFYNNPLRLTKELIYIPEHQLIQFQKGKLIYPVSNINSRKKKFIENILKLNIPSTDFSITFAGGDGAGSHATYPIHGYFRITGSEYTILWPLRGYTAIESKNFGHNINLNDRMWEQKMDKAVWRGTVTGLGVYDMLPKQIDSLIVKSLVATDPISGRVIPKANRLQLVSKFYSDKSVNIGLSSLGQTDEKAREYLCELGFLKPFLSQKEILSYKYLIVVDGNTFASQLPWSLHCNSLVLMVSPTWESIVAGVEAWVHYVPLATDFSDLKEKINWCRENDRQCKEISRAATELMRHYYGAEKENMIQQRLLDHYVENFQSC